MNNCQRGELWLVSFDPARGSEQSGTRPALIVQNNIMNKYSRTTIIAAVTSNCSDYPQNVLINPAKKNGLSKKSAIKLGQLLTIDQHRLIKKLGSISAQEIAKVEYSLQLSLGII